MAKGDVVHAAHTSPNQNFSILGVIGTLGTADTKGTALTLPFGVDPDTGAMFVNQTESAPDGTYKSNPTFDLQYDSNNNLATVVMYIGTTAYTKILGYDASNNLSTVGVWG